MPNESNDRSRILEHLSTIDTTGFSPDVSDDEDGDSLAAFDDDADHSNCIFPDSSWIDDLREHLLELQDDDCVCDDRVGDGCDSVSNCSSDTELSFAAPDFSPYRAEVDVLVDDEFQSDITPSQSDVTPSEIQLELVQLYQTHMTWLYLM